LKKLKEQVLFATILNGRYLKRNIKSSLNLKCLTVSTSWNKRNLWASLNFKSLYPKRQKTLLFWKKLLQRLNLYWSLGFQGLEKGHLAILWI